MLVGLSYGVIMSKFRGVKTNNAKTQAKEKIRRAILCDIENPSCLEVFCGAGEMYNSVWRECDYYTGIDINKYFDERNTICGDAEKAVTTIDLSKFNIFDIDAYGSPYTILDIITARVKPGLKYGFIITDGTQMDLKLGRICKGIRSLTGIEHHIAKRAHIIHDSLISDIIKTVELRLGGIAGNFIIANGKTGAAMKYYAFTITPNQKC